jgi:nucleotide-binding universal stress UspA family protein
MAVQNRLQDKEDTMVIPYKAVMVTVDGSALSEEALPHAALLAHQFQAELTLFRVVPSVSEEGVAVDVLLLGRVDLDEQQRDQIDEARRALQELVINLKFQKIAAKIVVEVGDAADRIVDHAKTHDIGLIVMSTHGRTGIQRWLLGSVAGKVSSAAPCPVLLIRPTPKSDNHVDDEVSRF